MEKRLNESNSKETTRLLLEQDHLRSRARWYALLATAIESVGGIYDFVSADKYRWIIGGIIGVLGLIPVPLVVRDVLSEKRLKKTENLKMRELRELQSKQNSR